MKYRAGFVSNSSSSSFCIFGVCVSPSELGLDEEKADLYELCDEAKLEHHVPDGYDGHFIGLSWSDVKDDETGKQFKERVEAAVKKAFPNANALEFSTHEEAYYN